jgi:hypothetical protein
VANKIIQESKREHWEKYCNSLTDSTKLGKIWKMAKSMDGNSNKQTLPNLKSDNKIYETNKEKAEILAESFASVSQDSNYDEEFLAHKREYEENYKQRFTDDASENEHKSKLNDPFTMYELNQAIGRTKDKSAPGIDTITYEMIKELPKE